jgi:hypothetical protein
VLETARRNHTGLRSWFECPLLERRSDDAPAGRRIAVFASLRALALAYRSERVTAEDRVVGAIPQRPQKAWADGPLPAVPARHRSGRTDAGMLGRLAAIREWHVTRIGYLARWSQAHRPRRYRSAPRPGAVAQRGGVAELARRTLAPAGAHRE